MIAMEPSSQEFHPKVGESPEVKYPGFGATASSIAALFRVGASGLFASVQNPFGKYQPRTNMTRAHDAVVTLVPQTEWDTLDGSACDNGGHVIRTAHVPKVVSDAECIGNCSVNPLCKQWQRNVQTGTCTLYNITARSEPNPKFNCGCRGPCPASPPAPPPPRPNPPGPPTPPTPNPNSIPPVLWAWYAPLFLQTTDHPVWYETEGCVIGATELQQYAADSHSAINLGEVKAFTEAVEATLMDTAEDGSRAPVRVHVGWDSNDYQIDLATTGGLEQYKRMLVRDQSLGVTHAIFAPRNSLESTRAAATDAWGWEETLWLGLGEKIRRAQWLPQRGDAVLTEIANIVSFTEYQTAGVRVPSPPIYWGRSCAKKWARMVV
eukprot:m.111816 g.111816  ORF g.111816 m.111816 type:complete len:378 (-) comp12950_c0_seq1:3522-4655(-)